MFSFFYPKYPIINGTRFSSKDFIAHIKSCVLNEKYEDIFALISAGYSLPKSSQHTIIVYLIDILYKTHISSNTYNNLSHLSKIVNTSPEFRENFFTMFLMKLRTTPISRDSIYFSILINHISFSNNTLVISEENNEFLNLLTSIYNDNLEQPIKKFPRLHPLFVYIYSAKNKNQNVMSKLYSKQSINSYSEDHIIITLASKLSVPVETVLQAIYSEIHSNSNSISIQEQLLEFKNINYKDLNTTNTDNFPIHVKHNIAHIEGLLSLLKKQSLNKEQSQTIKQLRNSLEQSISTQNSINFLTDLDFTVLVKNLETIFEQLNTIHLSVFKSYLDTTNSETLKQNTPLILKESF